MLYSEVVTGKPKYIEINRDQLGWGEYDVNAFIPQQHPARAIWQLSGRLNMSGFEQEICTREGDAGRPSWPPRLLFCVWVYAYSQGIASARAIERMMAYEPGFRWLCATGIINHHTLSDFRVDHKTKLDELMAQLLALLDHEGLIDLRVVAHDGTKIRAIASKYSFHRQRTIQDRLTVARRVIKQMEEAALQEESEPVDARKQAAQRRAAEESVERMEQSLGRLQDEQRRTTPSKRDDLRVSASEPQARRMKHPDGGWAPSYNVQVSTDAKHRIIVGIGVTDAASDTNELTSAINTVRRWCKRKPTKVLADGGYASRENVEAMAAHRITFIAPWKDAAEREAGALVTTGRKAEFAPSAFSRSSQGDSLVCPAGKLLPLVGQYQKHGQTCLRYESDAADCSECPLRSECFGSQNRSVRRVDRVQETAAMQAYLKRMQRPETQQLYKKRSEVAEFPHLWIKGRWKLRRFSVRGQAKAATEAIWAAMAYNIEQWVRLRWLPALA